MEEIGLRFKLKDGSDDCYDPLYYETDFTENETHYIIDSNCGEWTLLKEDVLSYEKYDLCPYCQHELYISGCANYNCENFN